MPNLHTYREAWKAAGHSGQGEVYLRAPVYVGDTLEQALSDPQDSLMNFYRYLGARLEESANSAGVFDTARRIEGAQRLQNLTWEEARRGRAIIGTPEIVADNLASLRDQLGLAGILAELNTGGGASCANDALRPFTSMSGSPEGSLRNLTVARRARTGSIATRSAYPCQPALRRPSSMCS